MSVDDDLPGLLDEGPSSLRLVHRTGLIVAALLCFALGVVGGFVLIMPGFLFHLLGLVCLGTASSRVARWINVQERRLPRRWREKLREHHPFERFKREHAVPAPEPGDRPEGGGGFEPTNEMRAGSPRGTGPSMGGESSTGPTE